MTRRLSLAGRIRSFEHAFRGLRTMFSSQHNAWIHTAATVVAVAAGLLLRLSRSDWCLLVLAIVSVWTAEALNTALELLCDAAAPAFHPLVKRSKDVAAAGVLVAALGAVAIGGLVFVPRMAELWSARFSPSAAAKPGPGAVVTVAATLAPADTEQSIGRYTIRLWAPGSIGSLAGRAQIAAPGQPDVLVENVEAIGDLPAADVTGEGDPDVLFTTYGGGSHCCWGTVIYSLGETPTRVLEMVSPPYQLPGTGQGTLEDLDGDGRYELVAYDPLAGIPCTQPLVLVVLEYDPAQGRYVGASPRFPGRYAREIDIHTRQAEKWIEKSRNGYQCGVYPVLADYLYTGQAERAREALVRLYLGTDRKAVWEQIQQAVRGGRYFVPLPGS